MQTGGSSYSTSMNNFIQGQIAAGNVVDCGAQCQPGNPGGVGQPGTNNSIYGWSYQAGSLTTTSVSSTIITGDTQSSDDGTFTITVNPGTWSYGVIGTFTDPGEDDLLAQNQPPSSIPTVQRAPKRPNIPPSQQACSLYRDGSGAGSALYNICMNFPNFPSQKWAGCVRGNLLNQYVPNGNPLDLTWYLFVDHPVDFLTCPIN